MLRIESGAPVQMQGYIYCLCMHREGSYGPYYLPGRAVQMQGMYIASACRGPPGALCMVQGFYWGGFESLISATAEWVILCTHKSYSNPPPPPRVPSYGSVLWLLRNLIIPTRAPPPHRKLPPT